MLAAENGSVSAQYTIGLWYFYGYQGWPQNKKEGLKWIKLAANNGDTLGGKFEVIFASKNGAFTYGDSWIPTF